MRNLFYEQLQKQSDYDTILKCGGCKHKMESKDISGETCYLCKNNPEDHRIDWFEEEETVCPECGGTGYVRFGPGIRGLKRCRRCTLEKEKKK